LVFGDVLTTLGGVLSVITVGGVIGGSFGCTIMGTGYSCAGGLFWVFPVP
jgi:hypothetical protein